MILVPAISNRNCSLIERFARSLILLSGWRRSAVAFASGSVTVFSVAPYDFFPVCFITFPMLVWLIDGVVTAHRSNIVWRFLAACLAGWWFGFGYFIFGLWWVGSAMLIEAESFIWALPIGVLALPAVLALFYGLATALACLLWSEGIGRLVALAAAFGFTEWLRGSLFTGFPWNPIGQAAMPAPLLMQSVAVIGMPGMNALSVLVFSLPALLAGWRHTLPGVILMVTLVAAHIGFGYYRLEVVPDAGGSKLNVRIVQPSVDQAMKLDGRAAGDVFQTLLTLSSAPLAEGREKPELILWPETAVPFLLAERPDALAELGKFLDDGQMLIAGAVRGESDLGADYLPRYFNSIMAIDGFGQIVATVDKVHLVPGGEYLPFEGFFQRLGIDRIVAMPQFFHPGGERQAITLPGGLNAAAFVCYEIIFPRLVADGVADADLIMNLTNDGWFGNTPGPYQHLRQAQIRAVETGRILLRAANTGISGAIDARGRVIDALGVNSQGVVDVSIKAGRLSEKFVGSSTRNGFIIIIVLGAIACGLNLSRRLKGD